MQREWSNDCIVTISNMLNRFAIFWFSLLYPNGKLNDCQEVFFPSLKLGVLFDRQGGNSFHSLNFQQECKNLLELANLCMFIYQKFYKHQPKFLYLWRVSALIYHYFWYSKKLSWLGLRITDVRQRKFYVRADIGTFLAYSNFLVKTSIGDIFANRSTLHNLIKTFKEFTCWKQTSWYPCIHIETSTLEINRLVFHVYLYQRLGQQFFKYK